MGRVLRMFSIYTKDCPKGWAYVRDYTGNLVYYGPIEECFKFIDQMMGWEAGTSASKGH